MQKTMQEALSVETLFDLSVYKDLDTANERLAEFGLTALYDKTGTAVIRFIEGGKTFATIGHMSASFDIEDERALYEAAATLTNAQEDYDSEGAADPDQISFEYHVNNTTDFVQVSDAPQVNLSWSREGYVALSDTPPVYQSWSIKIDDTGRINGISDERTANNVVRHEYRILDDAEKAAMKAIKDLGVQLIEAIEALGKSREYSLAVTKVEEAIMWGIKGLTK